MLFRRRSLSGTWGCSWISMRKHQIAQLFVQTNCKNPDKITELRKNVSLFTSQMEKYLRLWLKDTDIDMSRMLTNAYPNTPLMPSNIPWAVEAKKTAKTVTLSEHVSRHRDAYQTGRLARRAKWAAVAVLMAIFSLGVYKGTRVEPLRVGLVWREKKTYFLLKAGVAVVEDLRFTTVLLTDTLEASAINSNEPN